MQASIPFSSVLKALDRAVGPVQRFRALRASVSWYKCPLSKTYILQHSPFPKKKYNIVQFHHLIQIHTYLYQHRICFNFES
jgi:hypothetical protein